MKIDGTSIINTINDVNECSDMFDSMLDDITNSYTEHLDVLMESIYNLIVSVNDPPIATIEKHFLELTNAIYFIGGNVEKLGIRDDISNAMYKEVFNNEYLNQQSVDGSKKPTQSTLNALAENKALYESTVNALYKRAYKIVKFKIDSASDMVRTLSKVMSSRMQENSFVSTTERANEYAFANEQPRQYDT